jgi:hypothetical protein
MCWYSVLINYEYEDFVLICLLSYVGDSEVQRTMLELLNQLDGFEATKNIKVELLRIRYCLNIV